MIEPLMLFLPFSRPRSQPKIICHAKAERNYRPTNYEQHADAFLLARLRRFFGSVLGTLGGDLR